MKIENITNPVMLMGMSDDRRDAATLDYLLSLNGERILLMDGYWLKFEIKRVPPSETKPHGIDYSFGLHDPDNDRIFGMDNAHGVDHRGGRFVARPVAYDHEHRDEDDKGRPYGYTNAERLLTDFFAGVARRLADLGRAPNGGRI